MLRWFRSKQAPAALEAGFGMEIALSGVRDRGVGPNTIFDIGASDGGWSALALRIWPGAHVHCFEPLEIRAAALAAFAARHPGQVTHHAVGVSDADGELQLGVTDDLWASSFAYKGQSAQSARVRSLDSMLAEGAIEPPNFVKIDVQGFRAPRHHRRRGHAGGLRFHPDGMPVLSILFGDAPARRNHRLHGGGRLCALRIRGLLAPARRRAMGQCDILFIRRDHALMRDTRWA